MKKYKNKIISCIIFAITLVVAFFYQGNFSQNEFTSSQKETMSAEIPSELPLKKDNSISDEIVNESNKSKKSETPYSAPPSFEVSLDTAENAIPSNTQKKSQTNEKDTAKNVKVTSAPNASADDIVSEESLTCTLSVRCDTILENLNQLNDQKRSIVPSDGIIFKEQTVTFYEGENVFNLLVREMKKNNIHMEFENTPVYNSAYIEGIANLYEFDCGELSGWMYKVNGHFPNYGCSLYHLKSGDKVEWVYTCDLGADVGGDFFENGR